MECVEYSIKIYPNHKYRTITFGGVKEKFSGNLFLLGNDNLDVYDTISSIKSNLFTAGKFSVGFLDITYSMEIKHRGEMKIR